MNVPTPEITDLTRPYWEGLAAGRLLFQQCAACGRNWLPPRRHCPSCLASDPLWQQAAGGGRVVSWVVYHHAYAEHLAARIPYDVTLVELDEGPRLLTNVVDSDAGRRLSIGARVSLAIEEEGGIALARFRLGDGGLVG